MVNLDELKNKLQNITSVKFNEDMSKHCSFKLGGKAFCFCEPSNISELKKILSLCVECNTPYFIFGKGTNTVFRDGGYKGIVISLKKFNKITELKKYIKIDAGVNIFSLNMFAREHNFGNLEFSFGIPGSVGGAVYMNAGAYGREFKDVIKKVTFLHNGKIVTKKVEELDFSYRHSYFQNSKDIIISVILDLPFKKKEDIIYLQNVYFDKRKFSQPLEYPSAGSVFKRKGDIIPAKLIDELGLKGKRIGGVEVSKKHSGFIVNVKNGTASELEELINFVKQQVEYKTSIKLENEIIFIGDKL